MAGLTKAQIDAHITAINTQLTAILADPDGTSLDYKIGDKAVNKDKKVQWLMKMLDNFTKTLTKLPAESIDSVEYGIDAYGKDRSEYIGDPD